MNKLDENSVLVDANYIEELKKRITLLEEKLRIANDIFGNDWYKRYMEGKLSINNNTISQSEYMVRKYKL